MQVMKHKATRTLLSALFAAGAITVWTKSAGAQSDPRDDKSPWAIASGAEWAGDYPKFNPMLKEAGMRWLRAGSEWQSIQPKRGEWKFEWMDKMVADARANDIKIAGCFAYFAPWASATGDTRTGPIKDIAYFREYVEGMVTHYKDDIKYWEVWNEFNGSFYNTKTGDKPGDYAALVVAAHQAAKKVDSGIMIGMSCANFDIGFFDLAIKAGAADHFDFIAVHPYENLGMAMAGNEGAYLTLAGSIRKMLADNKQRTDMPLWITETGVQAPIQPDATKDAYQADAIVKVFVLSIAQGFDKIFWFEARGPAYGKGTDHGFIRQDWTPRPAFHAAKTMTGLLGAEPKYVGWLDVSGGYGFVFESARGDVLVTWAPPKKDVKPIFSADVRVVQQSGAEAPLAKGDALALTTSPTFIADLPADLGKQARENAGKPFPWSGGYADAKEVTCRLAATNVDQGIQQMHLKTTDVVHLLDQSYRRSRATKGGEGHYAYFRVDTEFASFGNKQLEITLVAKRADPNRPAHTSLTYESMTGYKGAKGGRWQIPAGDEWQEHTWKVDDANFVGGWGWNFRTDAGGSPGEFLIKEVRVKKAGK